MLFQRLLDFLTGINAVAGVLGPKGALRIIVGPLANMKHHVGDGERLFITPARVRGHVPWEEIPRVIRETTDYVRRKHNQ